MLFEVGETVVYPHHGAATIIEVKERVIKGETKKYLKLNVTQGDLVIEVPADNVDLVGVRDDQDVAYRQWAGLRGDVDPVGGGIVDGPAAGGGNEVDEPRAHRVDAGYFVADQMTRAGVRPLDEPPPV